MSNASVKLSQREAMLLEAARAHGFVDEEIIHKLRKGNPEPFLEIEEEKYDFTPLFSLYEEDFERLEEAIREGYTIKYTTFNGIKFLLNKRYGLETPRDYESGEDYLDSLKLTDQMLEWLRATISSNWRIVELERKAKSEEAVIRIEWNG
ncbi:hypothetical protein EDM52_14940 [Brevibacillus invocatus]|uniref:Uncharacterized protein n=1 Tax=Brevibacillus invocatus TaxID=173959 RepID=A0A3M8C998_9BACL|nr:hypothetical protein [Brevibacillus invocatus]RNB71535.1 hypothetical protein EDM52_14940 [Brevibacillus invocatus]